MKDRAVLVVEAQSIGAVAVIRSLGRAGWNVHACATTGDALGLRSRFATRAVCSPDYDDPHYVDWLQAYVEKNHIACIVPSENLLLRIRDRFREFAPLLPLAGDAAIVYRGLSKHDVHCALLDAGAETAAHLPPTMTWSDGQPMPALSALTALPAPYFIKADGLHARRRGVGGAVIRADDAPAARDMIGKLQNQYTHLLIQGFVPGRGVGAFFLLWNGQVRARFMHRRLHEVPHTGGHSSLRASHFSEEILEDALARLRALDWTGVAMLDYRVEEATGTPWFIEMNGRFRGSLHLAMYAGVDFPRILLECFSGRCPEGPPPSWRPGVRARLSVPLDVQHVVSKVRDPALPVRSKLAAVLEFGLLSLDPRVHSDLLFPGDRRLHYIMLRQFAARLTGNGRVGRARLP
jgi:hypothetical protein